MKTYSSQIELTAYHWEGFRPYAYPDPGSAMYAQFPNAEWGFKPISEIVKGYRGDLLLPYPITIGFGSTRDLIGDTIDPNSQISEEEAFTLFEADWNICQLQVRALTHLSSGPSFDAIVDYAYNVGLSKSPKLIADLRVSRMFNAARELLDSFTAQGKPLMGLLLRRISEYNTFLGGGYKAWEKGDPVSSQLKQALLDMNYSNPAAIRMINTLAGES